MLITNDKRAERSVCYGVTCGTPYKTRSSRSDGRGVGGSTAQDDEGFLQPTFFPSQENI